MAALASRATTVTDTAQLVFNFFEPRAAAAAEKESKRWDWRDTTVTSNSATTASGANTLVRVEILGPNLYTKVSQPHVDFPQHSAFNHVQTMVGYRPFCHRPLHSPQLQRISSCWIPLRDLLFLPSPSVTSSAVGSRSSAAAATVIPLRIVEQLWRPTVDSKLSAADLALCPKCTSCGEVVFDNQIIDLTIASPACPESKEATDNQIQMPFVHHLVCLPDPPGSNYCVAVVALERKKRQLSRRNLGRLMFPRCPLSPTWRKMYQSPELLLQGILAGEGNVNYRLHIWLYWVRTLPLPQFQAQLTTIMNTCDHFLNATLSSSAPSAAEANMIESIVCELFYSGIRDLCMKSSAVTRMLNKLELNHHMTQNLTREARMTLSFLFLLGPMCFSESMAMEVKWQCKVFSILSLWLPVKGLYQPHAIPGTFHFLSELLASILSQAKMTSLYCNQELVRGMVALLVSHLGSRRSFLKWTHVCLSSCHKALMSIYQSSASSSSSSPASLWSYTLAPEDDVDPPLSPHYSERKRAIFHLVMSTLMVAIDDKDMAMVRFILAWYDSHRKAMPAVEALIFDVTLGHDHKMYGGLPEVALDDLPISDFLAKQNDQYRMWFNTNLSVMGFLTGWNNPLYSVLFHTDFFPSAELGLSLERLHTVLQWMLQAFDERLVQRFLQQSMSRGLQHRAAGHSTNPELLSKAPHLAKLVAAGSKGLSTDEENLLVALFTRYPTMLTSVTVASPNGPRQNFITKLLALLYHGSSDAFLQACPRLARFVEQSMLLSESFQPSVMAANQCRQLLCQTEWRVITAMQEYNFLMSHILTKMADKITVPRDMLLTLCQNRHVGWICLKAMSDDSQYFQILIMRCVKAMQESILTGVKAEQEKTCCICDSTAEDLKPQRQHLISAEPCGHTLCSSCWKANFANDQWHCPAVDATKKELSSAVHALAVHLALQDSHENAAVVHKRLKLDNLTCGFQPLNVIRLLATHTQYQRVSEMQSLHVEDAFKQTVPLCLVHNCKLPVMAAPTGISSIMGPDTDICPALHITCAFCHNEWHAPLDCLEWDGLQTFIGQHQELLSGKQSAAAPGVNSARQELRNLAQTGDLPPAVVLKQTVLSSIVAASIHKTTGLQVKEQEEEKKPLTGEEQRALDLRVNEHFVEKETKPCPKCAARIIKTDGCRHMTCTRCKHQFCWVCVEDYFKGDHSRCDEEEEAKEVDQQAQQLAALNIDVLMPLWNKGLDDLWNPYSMVNEQALLEHLCRLSVETTLPPPPSFISQKSMQPLHRRPSSSAVEPLTIEVQQQQQPRSAKEEEKEQKPFEFTLSSSTSAFSIGVSPGSSSTTATTATTATKEAAALGPANHALALLALTIPQLGLLLRAHLLSDTLMSFKSPESLNTTQIVRSVAQWYTITQELSSSVFNDLQMKVWTPFQQLFQHLIKPPGPPVTVPVVTDHLPAIHSRIEAHKSRIVAHMSSAPAVPDPLPQSPASSFAWTTMITGEGVNVSFQDKVAKFNSSLNRAAAPVAFPAGGGSEKRTSESTYEEKTTTDAAPAAWYRAHPQTSDYSIGATPP